MINNLVKIGKALALLCFVMFAFPLTASANYAAIGNGHNTANGNTITYTATPGNYLVVGVFTSAGGGSPTATIADNGSGSTWTTQLATTTFASSFFTFFSGVAGTGVTTITLTFNGGTPGSVIAGVVEYSGLSATGWQAISAGNLQAVPGSPAGTGTNAVTSNALTVAAQPAALVGWVFELGGNGGGTAGTSPITFTRRLNFGGIMTEDARVVSTGSAVANATNSNGSVDSLVTYAIAISESGGGGAAVLVGAATDSILASASLTTSPAGYGQIPLDNPVHVNGSDQISMGSGPNTGTGDSSSVAFTKLKQWAADINTMMSQLYPVRSLQTPTTGFTLAAAAGVTLVVLNPAGTLATGTVTFPPAPGDNQPLILMSSQTVTALTLNTSDGSLINGAPSGLAANIAIRFRFMFSLGKWFREQ